MEAAWRRGYIEYQWTEGLNRGDGIPGAERSLCRCLESVE